MLQARQGCAKDTPTAGQIRWPDLGGPVSAGLTNGVRHSGLASGVITQDRGAHHFPVSLFRPCERVVEYPLFRITNYKVKASRGGLPGLGVSVLPWTRQK